MFLLLFCSENGHLMYKGIDIAVRRSFTTKARIRKWLENPFDKTCIICYEEAKYGCSATCRSCSARTCLVCFLKHNLTEQAIEKIFSSVLMTFYAERMPYQCVQCRATGSIDFWGIYYKVLDCINQFSELQRRAILEAKTIDGSYEEKMELWTD